MKESDQKGFWDHVENKKIDTKKFILSVDFYKKEDYKNKFYTLKEESKRLKDEIVKINFFY